MLGSFFVVLYGKPVKKIHYIKMSIQLNTYKNSKLYKLTLLSYTSNAVFINKLHL